MIFRRKQLQPLTQDDLLRLQIQSERSDIRWKRSKRVFFAAITLWSLGTVLVLPSLKNAGTEKSHAPVVRIEGGIAGDNSKINADSVIKTLRTAFDDEKASAVILYIDSPGGSPAEAERINNFIQHKKAETKKPLYAVCANMCASAGYMIAMQGDQVYASKYSLIGSIGAVLSSWNFSEAINKFGVQHNAYASGKLKAMLNPYSPVKAEDEEKAQILVEGMGKIFAQEVAERRKDKLTTKVDLFTGEVWDGSHAQTLGLVDRIGTLDDVVRENFPEGVAVKELSRPGRGRMLFNTAADAFAQSLVNAAARAGHFSIN